MNNKSHNEAAKEILQSRLPFYYTSLGAMGGRGDRWVHCRGSSVSLGSVGSFWRNFGCKPNHQRGNARRKKPSRDPAECRTQCRTSSSESKELPRARFLIKKIFLLFRRRHLYWEWRRRRAMSICIFSSCKRPTQDSWIASPLVPMMLPPLSLTWPSVVRT